MRLFNSLWILFLAAVGFSLVISFAYLFLFSEELNTNEKSVEDELVATGGNGSLIRNVLCSGDHIPNQVVYCLKYGQYQILQRRCNKTLTDASPKFTKLVLIIIDALRVDFVPSILSPHFSTPRMPYMEQLVKTHGLGFQSVATIPTVTLARIKAILSGCIPSFMDYIMNLNAYAFKKDNIVEQMWSRNKSIVFYGDDTWGKLFPQGIFARSNFTTSLYATDYTEVDTNVTYNVNQELKNLTRWDVMMLHYLGVDHIGHLQGFNSHLFHAKLIEMDDVFRSIFDAVSFSGQPQNESYLFLVTGDHGMTNSGNHGGSTRDETHTALIFISSNKSHNHPSGYKRDLPVQERTFLQIDIAPTIAALFNLPVPSKSQGRIISPILERFDAPPSEHLCLLFQNAFHIQHIVKKEKMDDAKLKSHLLDALTSHYNYANNEAVHEKKTADFERARDAYQRFISAIQQQYVKSATDRSFFSLLTLPIALCYLIIIALVRIEYVHNTGSIIFRRPFHLSRLFQVREWLPTLPPDDALDYTNLAVYFSNLRFFSSSPARVLMTFLLSLNLVFMGSTNFMEYEHLFWHYLAAFLLVLNLIVVLRGYFAFTRSKWKALDVMKRHYVNVILQLITAIALFKLMTIWKIPVITDSDLQQWDVISWLTQKQSSSKHTLTAVFLISLVVIAFSTTTKSAFGRPPTIFVAALIFTYLYRCSTGSTYAFKVASKIVSNLPANFCAQVVYIKVLLILFYCMMLKLKSSFPRNNRAVKCFFNMLNGLMLSADYSSLLHSFLIVWVIMSTLLVDPSYVPLLAFNILLEKLIYYIFSTSSDLPQLDSSYLYSQMFYRLGTYLVLANSAFYQIGNTNSLSTVDVNSCFVGLGSYMPVPCTIFMVISIYSTYAYWFIMFFVRMQQDLMPLLTKDQVNTDAQTGAAGVKATAELGEAQLVDDETEQFISNLIARKNPIVLNYCTFYSITNCMLIIRLLVMTLNMSVTFALRDHLFIWSVICPKLLYEIIFSALHLAIAIIMSVIFTHDNYFSLH